MKTKLTLAAIAATLACGTASADAYLYLDRDPMGSGTTYVYPGSVYVVPSESPSTVWVVPAPVSEPFAGTRNYYVPAPSTTFGSQNTTTNTPNPNRVQNNGVPTQYETYDTYYIYRIDSISP